MGPQVSAGFRQAKERLETWNELKARLPQQQEELSRQNYQLRQIEHALASVEVQLEQLESFSLGGLLDAMLGKKEGKIRALKDEAARLQTDLEAATGTLTETDSMVRQIEQQLVAMGDPQKALAAQLEAAERALLEAAGESPTELSEVNSRLTFGRARRRELQKAVQIGKHLIERLHNMTNSLGRTQQKLLFGGPLGVVGNVALNAAARHGTGAMVQRVRDGLVEFGRSIKSLDLIEATELDVELARLGDVIEGLHANLAGEFDSNYFCDTRMTRPFLDPVQTAIGHLESKLDRVNAEVGGLERERMECIERAMEREEGTEG